MIGKTNHLYCNQCEQIKPSTAFRSNGNSKKGKRKRVCCIACDNEQRKERHQRARANVKKA